MMPNRGTRPPEARGKRVIVKLRNGRLCGTEPVSSTTPLGWAADTTRWSLTGDPFDVLEYQVLP